MIPAVRMPTYTARVRNTRQSGRVPCLGTELTFGTAPKPHSDLKSREWKALLKTYGRKGVNNVKKNWLSVLGAFIGASITTCLTPPAGLLVIPLCVLSVTCAHFVTGILKK